MLPYWLLFGFFALGAFFTTPNPDPNKRLGSLRIAWVVLVLFIGLRGHIGQDWAAYLGWCLKADRLSFTRYMRDVYSDYAFYAVIWLLRSISSPYWVVNSLFAIAFSTGLVAFARTQINPWLAILIAVPYLVIVMALSGMRQSTAIGFEFLSLVALSKENKIRSFFWQFMAALCHASSVVLVPLLALSYSRSKIQSIFISMIFALTAYYVLSSSIDSYWTRYVSTTRFLQSSGTPVRIATNVMAALAYIAYRRSFAISRSAHLLWMSMSLMSLAAVPLYFYVSSSTALDRTLLYLFPLQIFALGSLVYVGNTQLHKVLSGGLILLYLAAQLFVFLNFGTNAQAYIPYRITEFAD